MKSVPSVVMSKIIFFLIFIISMNAFSSEKRDYSKYHSAKSFNFSVYKSNKLSKKLYFKKGEDLIRVKAGKRTSFYRLKNKRIKYIKSKKKFLTRLFKYLFNSIEVEQVESQSENSLKVKLRHKRNRYKVEKIYYKIGSFWSRTKVVKTFEENGNTYAEIDITDIPRGEYKAYFKFLTSKIRKKVRWRKEYRSFFGYGVFEKGMQSNVFANFFIEHNADTGFVRLDGAESSSDAGSIVEYTYKTYDGDVLLDTYTTPDSELFINFQNEGTFGIELTVRDELGNFNTSERQFVTIDNSQGALPLALFSCSSNIPNRIRCDAGESFSPTGAEIVEYNYNINGVDYIVTDPVIEVEFDSSFQFIALRVKDAVGNLGEELFLFYEFPFSEPVRFDISCLRNDYERVSCYVIDEVYPVNASFSSIEWSVDEDVKSSDRALQDYIYKDSIINISAEITDNFGLKRKVSRSIEVGTEEEVLKEIIEINEETFMPKSGIVKLGITDTFNLENYSINIEDSLVDKDNIVIENGIISIPYEAQSTGPKEIVFDQNGEKTSFSIIIGDKTLNLSSISEFSSLKLFSLDYSIELEITDLAVENLPSGKYWIWGSGSTGSDVKLLNIQNDLEIELNPVDIATSAAPVENLQNFSTWTDNNFSISSVVRDEGEALEATILPSVNNQIVIRKKFVSTTNKILHLPFWFNNISSGVYFSSVKNHTTGEETLAFNSINSNSIDEKGAYGEMKIGDEMEVNIIIQVDEQSSNNVQTSLLNNLISSAYAQTSSSVGNIQVRIEQSELVLTKINFLNPKKRHSVGGFLSEGISHPDYDSNIWNKLIINISLEKTSINKNLFFDVWSGSADDFEGTKVKNEFVFIEGENIISLDSLPRPHDKMMYKFCLVGVAKCINADRGGSLKVFSRLNFIEVPSDKRFGRNLSREMILHGGDTWAHYSVADFINRFTTNGGVNDISFAWGGDASPDHKRGHRFGLEFDTRVFNDIDTQSSILAPGYNYANGAKYNKAMAERLIDILSDESLSKQLRQVIMSNFPSDNDRTQSSTGTLDRQYFISELGRCNPATGLLYNTFFKEDLSLAHADHQHISFYDDEAITGRVFPSRNLFPDIFKYKIIADMDNSRATRYKIVPLINGQPVASNLLSKFKLYKVSRLDGSRILVVDGLESEFTQDVLLRNGSINHELIFEGTAEYSTSPNSPNYGVELNDGYRCQNLGNVAFPLNNSIFTAEPFKFGDLNGYYIPFSRSLKSATINGKAVPEGERFVQTDDAYAGYRLNAIFEQPNYTHEVKKVYDAFKPNDFNNGGRVLAWKITNFDLVVQEGRFGLDGDIDIEYQEVENYVSTTNFGLRTVSAQVNSFNMVAGLGEFAAILDNGEPRFIDPGETFDFALRCPATRTVKLCPAIGSGLVVPFKGLLVLDKGCQTKTASCE